MKRWMAYAGIALVIALSSGGAMGQPVQRYVSFEQPSRSVAADLTPFFSTNDRKKKVALFRSVLTEERTGAGQDIIPVAVQQWELLLLGLRIPFRWIDEGDLAKKIDPELAVLIMPSAELLSDRHKRRIENYVKDGGGLIASGRIGFFDDEGMRADNAWTNDLLGADVVVDVKQQPSGFMHSIDGATPLGDGILPDFQFNVAAQTPLVLSRPGVARAGGRFLPYAPTDVPLYAGLTSILYHEYGAGRVVWFGFNPQDIPRRREEQENYQRLVVNTLTLLARATSVSFAPWPEGKPMAVSVAAMNAAGFDALTFSEGMDNLLAILEQLGIPGSFFLSSNEVRVFPEVLERMREIGEIGLTADEDELLVEQPMEIQVDRIRMAQTQLGVGKIHGVYPPAGLYDANTIRAMEELDADYLLQGYQPVMAPRPVDWWDHADYRERLDLADLMMALDVDMPLFVPGEEQVPSQALSREQVDALPDPTLIVPLSEGIAATHMETYERIKQAQGYQVIPYYPETYSSRSEAAADFEATLIRAESEGAWMTTPSDAVTWWVQRGQVRPVIVFLGASEMHVDLVNDGPNVVDGLVLQLRGPRDAYQGIRISGVEGSTRYDAERQMALVDLPPVGPGTTRIVLTWRR